MKKKMGAKTPMGRVGTWFRSSRAMAAKVGIAAIKVHHFLHLALEASRPVQFSWAALAAFSEGELFGVVLSFAGTCVSSPFQYG